MKIEPITLESKEYAVFIGDKPIPLSLIKSFVQVIALFVFFALAYNVGISDAQTFHKWVTEEAGCNRNQSISQATGTNYSFLQNTT